jgi:hypothetical protein
MKTFKTLLTIGFLMALAIGCSTGSHETENMLSAAGFKMVPADTPERQAHLNSLPKGQVTMVQRNGTMYYAYPDQKQNVLYVGQQPQYQKYQQLRMQKQMADEQLNTAAMYNDQPWGVWGPWGAGPGWAWR